jgi:hypothetical protein
MTDHAELIERLRDAARLACREIMGPSVGTPEYIAKHADRLLKRRDDAANAYADAVITVVEPALSALVAERDALRAALKALAALAQGGEP